MNKTKSNGLVFFCKDEKSYKEFKKSLTSKTVYTTISDVHELKLHLKKHKPSIILIDYKSIGKDLDLFTEMIATSSLTKILLIRNVTENVLATSLSLNVKYYFKYSNIKSLQELLKKNTSNTPNSSKNEIQKPKFSNTKTDFLSDETLLKIMSTNFPNSYMAIIDKSLKVVYTGGSEFRDNNIDPDSYVNKTVQKIFKPYGNKITKVFVDAYKKTLQGKSQKFTLQINKQDHEYSTTPIRSGKNVVALLVIAENNSFKTSTAKKLKSKEEIYETTLNRITDGFVALDKQWCFTYMNKSAGSIFNLNPSSVIGQNLWKIFPSDLSKVFCNAYKKAMKTQLHIYMEAHYKPNDKWYENHIYPSKNGISIYFRDITTKKINEQTIISLKSKAESALRVGKIGYWEWDIENDIVSWSGRMYKIFGLHKGSSLKYDTVLQLVHPDDRAYHIDLVKNVLKNKRSKGFEYRIIKPNNELGYVEGNLEVLCNKKGKAIKLQGTVVDHTIKHETELNLKESEHKYRTLVEQASDAIFIINHKGYFTSFNRSTAKLCGYSKSEMMKKTIYDILVFGKEHEGPFSLENLISGKTVSSETYIKCRTGKLINVELSAKLIEENKILVFARDISKRKKIENELIRSRTMFKNLIENIKGVYWINDLDTKKTIYISPSYEQIWGRKCKDLYKNPDDFINAVHPDDKTAFINAYQNINKNRSINIDFKIIRPNGQIRWIEANTSVVHTAIGGTIEYGYAEDITEKHRSDLENQGLQARNQQMISSMLDGYILADDKGSIIEINDAYCKLSGYTQKELLNKNINELEATLSVEEIKARINEMIENQKLRFETRHKKKNGKLYDLSVSSIIMESGGRSFVAAFVRDITEQNIAKDKISRYAEQLKQLTTHLQNVREDERVSLSRELHDDIGQQLLAIKIDLTRLASQMPQNDVARQQISDLKKLIDDTINSVRRINSDLRPSLLDDIGLFAALEHQVKEFSRRTNIEFDLRFNMDEPQLDNNMSIGIFRIFQESLTNIVRHSEAKKVEAQLNQRSGRMELIITDNGKGFKISDGPINKTFGLLGMRERANMMNGTLKLESKLGKGTTLELSVPLDKNS